AIAGRRDRKRVAAANVWQFAIESLIKNEFSPGVVRLFARAALATGSGRSDQAWRARLSDLASYISEPRPHRGWLIAAPENPRVRSGFALSMLGTVLIGIVLFVVIARLDVPLRRIAVTESKDKLTFPPITAEEGASRKLSNGSQIYAMA